MAHLTHDSRQHLSRNAVTILEALSVTVVGYVIHAEFKLWSDLRDWYLIPLLFSFPHRNLCPVYRLQIKVIVKELCCDCDV